MKFVLVKVVFDRENSHIMKFVLVRGVFGRENGHIMKFLFLRLFRKGQIFCN